MAMAVAALPAKAEDAVRLALNHEDGIYRSGEVAKLTVELSADVVSEGEWSGQVSWQRAWNPPEEQIELPISDDVFELEFADEEPGLVVVKVVLKSEQDPELSHTESIGMLFQPEAIKLSTREPEDFDEFWAERKAYWRTLPDDIVLTEVDSPESAIKVWNVAISMKGETPVSGYLAVPVDADEASLPAILTVHGAGFRSSSLPGIVRQAKMGFLALDINAHGLPNGMPDEFYEKAGREIGNDFRSRGVQSRETWYFHGMYLRVLTGLDFLTGRSEWNGDDLVLRGSSQGGAQVFAGAGLDPRVTVIAASVPAMCDLSGSLAGRRGGWPRPMPASVRGTEEGERIHETFGYYDSGLFAKRIEADAIVSLGLIDATCPADGIQATINNLKGEVVPLYRPRMPHAIPWEINAEFDRFIEERVTFPKK